MGNAHVVLIVPLGELGGGAEAGQLPGAGGAHPWLPGHGGGGARPDQGLPGGGHISGQPVPPVSGLPPRVWPPQNVHPWLPGHGGPTQPIKPPTAGTKPVEPEQGLPAGSALVLVYTNEGGWQGGVVDQSGTTKPIAPPEAAPK